LFIYSLFIFIVHATAMLLNSPV